MGASSLLFGDLRASARETGRSGLEPSGAAMAAFDPADLAAAADPAQPSTGRP